jgi:hypothetical protein
MVEHTTISGIAMGFDPKVTDRYQPLAGKPLIGHPGLGGQGLGQMPVAFATDRCQDRLAFARAQGQQIADLGTRPAPLFPIAHADASSDPVVDFRHGPVVFRDAKIVLPASQVLGKSAEPVGHRDPPTATGQFPDPVLEVCEGLLRPAEFVPPKSEPEENALVDRTDTALGFVDDQLEPAGQVPGKAGLDALAGPVAFDQDEQIIGVTSEAQAASLQFLVEVVQQGTFTP